MQWTVLASMLVLACASGCAHVGTVPSAPRAAPRVVVLDPHVETATPLDVALLRNALAEGLSHENALAPIASDGLPEPDAACFERLACMRAIGREADADFVAATSIAVLGDTAMVRVRLVDVRETGAEQSRQSVVEPAAPAALSRALELVGRALASPYAPRPEVDPRVAARRTRWRWLGPVLAASVAGVATGSYLLLRPEPRGPDVIIVPP